MKTHRILLTAAAAFALASCSAVKESGAPASGGREELKLSSGIHTATVESAVMGRSGGGELAFPEGAMFTLIVEDAGNSFPGVDATGKIENDGNTVSLTPRLFWDDLGGVAADLDLYGIYCPGFQVDGLVSPGNSEIQWTIDPGSLEVSDLMRAHVNYTYDDKGTPAHLTFEHVLSKISIEVIAGVGYQQADFNDAVVTYHIPGSVTYNYKTEVIAPVGSDGALEIPTPQSDYTYTILSLPLNKSVGEHLATITDNRGNNYNVNFPNQITMEPGHHYTFNVTVHKSEITVTASITDWNDLTPEVTESQLVIPGNIAIADAPETHVEDGTLLYIHVNDGTTEGNTSYVYNGGTWTALSTPLYWDDFARSFTTQSLLILKGDEDAGGNIFVATNDESRTDVATTINLGEFTRPFCKITVKVTSEVEPGKEDAAVNLPGLQHIKFKESHEYLIDFDLATVSSTGTLLQVDASGDYYNAADHTFTAYILPNANNNLLDGVLCEIAIQENDHVENLYNLRPPSSTTFEAGKYYQYTVNITKSEITTTASLVDWAEGGTEPIETEL